MSSGSLLPRQHPQSCCCLHIYRTHLSGQGSKAKQYCMVGIIPQRKGFKAATADATGTCELQSVPYFYSAKRYAQKLAQGDLTEHAATREPVNVYQSPRR